MILISQLCIKSGYLTPIVLVICSECYFKDLRRLAI